MASAAAVGIAESHPSAGRRARMGHPRGLYMALARLPRRLRFLRASFGFAQDRFRKTRTVGITGLNFLPCQLAFSGHQQKRASTCRWPHLHSVPPKNYFVQVSLIIFTSVTLKLPIGSLLDAFSTCPSFFSSTFASGPAVPVTVT
jgi:hypothetical protein